MWIRAYYTNKGPKIIAGYFVEIYPGRIRSDRGTENSSIENIRNSFG